MESFKTRARAIELLGRKQIRDSVTALAELMKNSYDADAPWLRVEFEVGKIPEHIIIADGGLGMTHNDIQEKWLVLGTNSKTNSKSKKSLGGRTLMGAKGIGRLASARLGKQLWMFTKSINSLWNVIYINWNLFENPYLALEDIQIPVMYGISKERLIEQFEVVKNELLVLQKANLELAGWFEDIEDDTVNGKRIIKEMVPLYRDTQKCINNCSISPKHINKYLTIDKGTILYIDILNDSNWEKCFAPLSNDKKSEDLVTEKYFNRFASFVSAFRHAGTKEDLFDVKVYINNKLWEEDYSYVEEDYKLYDIKIEGKIENGKFFGTIDARNADKELIQKANRILSNGRDVTQGIANWREADCGPFNLKLCHIEGEGKGLTGLAKDDYDRLKRKLEVTGGICVYRDGVRVLPYGEPENDFLNMEERRSYNAGNYIFSHRNIFGRIDIDTHNNPYLEDKSSREGLIENNQYFYFIKTMENLLIDLGFNFFSDARKDSLQIRENYVERNKREKEEKREKERVEKEEKRKSAIYIKELRHTLEKNQRELKFLSDQVRTQVSQWKSKVYELKVESGYNTIVDYSDKIKREYDTMHTLLQESERKLLITISKRFLPYCDENLSRNVMDYNRDKSHDMNAIKLWLDKEFEIIYCGIQQKIEQWREEMEEVVETSPELYAALLRDRVHTVTESCNGMLYDMELKIKKNQDELNQQTIPAKRLLRGIDNYGLQIKETKKYKEIVSEIKAISSLETEIENIFNDVPENVAIKGHDLLERIEGVYQKVYRDLKSFQIVVGEKYENCFMEAKKLKVDIDRSYSDDYVIGELKIQNARLESENEIYSDLASLGLASEIVNHEFNQLFTNVKNAIKNLNPYVRDSNARYWLRQIEVGFQAVSDRQNQLSPMYRSYSLRKRKVNLKKFLDDVCSFMENILEKEEILVENLVEEDAELILSPSKMFPVISNIVNNASYWVLSAQEKIIRFRYVSFELALYIEDSGSGITAIDRESIFQPFVSYKPNGRGLGLAIVKKVLESQGYGISIATDEEKTLLGACFKITFKDE